MNIDFSRYDFQSILHDWLSNTLVTIGLPKICDLKIRAYGGWNINGVESPLRFDASKFYQTHCPALYQIGDNYFRLSFEFAETLFFHKYVDLHSEIMPFQNTVVERRAPDRIVKNRVDCFEPNCELRKVKRWLKNRKACTNPLCPLTFSDMFYRQEQKQVDVHLALDFITAIKYMTSCLNICILSNDLDIVPALVFASIENPGNKLITVGRTKSGVQYCDDYLNRNNTVILYF